MISNSLYARSLIKKDMTIQNAKDEINFTNGNADYSKFIKNYDSDRRSWRGKVAKDSTGRKFRAIPNIALGLFKTIGHLFLASVALITLNIPPSKALLFAAIRDLEEVYGNFIVIFKDKLGLFHIEQAEFQKLCYFLYEGLSSKRNPSKTEPQKPVSSPKLTEKYDLTGATNGKYIRNDWVSNAAKEITLLDYRKLSVEDRKNVVSRIDNFCSLKLNKAIKDLETQGIDLSQVLEKHDEQTLQTLTLEDLLYFDLSPLKLALLTDEQFKKLKLKDIDERSPGENENPIKAPSESQSHKAKYILERLKTIEFNKEDIALFTDKSNVLHCIELSDLSIEQCNALFIYSNGEEVTKRLKLFKKEDLIKALENNKFPDNLLNYFPKEYLSEVRFSSLTEDVINKLFSPLCDEKDHIFSNREKQETFDANKAIFAKFDPEDVGKTLDSLFVSPYVLSLLSSEQLKAQKLANPKTIYHMFLPNRSPKKIEEDKARFANFNPENVAKAVETLNLGSYVLSLLSPEQLKALTLTNPDFLRFMFPSSDKPEIIAEHRARFAQLNPEKVAVAVSTFDLTNHILLLLSPEQLKALPPTIACRLWNMFPNKFTPETLAEEQARYANLSTEVINKAEETGYLPFGGKLLSLEHLKALKLTSVYTIFSVFPSQHREEEIAADMARFAYLNPQNLAKLLETLNVGQLLGAPDPDNSNRALELYFFRLLSPEHLKALKLSNMKASTISSLFPETYLESIQYETDKIRFAYLDPQEVQKAYGAKLLSPYAISLAKDIGIIPN